MIKQKVTYHLSPLSTQTKDDHPRQAHDALYDNRIARLPSPTTDENTDDTHDFDVPPEFLNRLATFPLFNKAPKSFHSRIAAELTLMQYHPQEYIIKKGDPSKSMYWILKGTVGVTSTDGESIYAELAPGDFFGEIGILFNRPRTATVIARTKVLVGVLTSNTLNMVLKNYPLIERRIRDEAQERLAMLDKKKKYDLPSVISNSLPSLENHVPVHLTQVQPTSLMNGGVQASALATKYSTLPGPSIPPIMHSPSPLSSSSVASNKPSDNVDASVSIQAFITSIPLFQNLPSDIMHRVALEVEPLHMNAFEYVFHKGDTTADMFFVIKGDLEVIDFLEDPARPQDCCRVENILGRLGVGAYFGEMSFLDLLTENVEVSRRSASVRTISLSELMVVKSDSLKKLCSEYPTIAEDMRKTAYERNMLNNSTRKKLFEKCRLSINFLINDTVRTAPSLTKSPIHSPHLIERSPSPSTCTSTVTPILQSQSTKLAPILYQPLARHEQPPTLFNSNWDFQGKNASLSSTVTSQFSDKMRSRSVSPITNIESPVGDGEQKKRPFQDTKPEEPTTLHLELPPFNPVAPSLNNFQNFLSSANNSRRSSMFQYLPQHKRARLASVSGPRGRRRSSALSNNGPLPDKILLNVFEYLPLPTLMKLRLMSKRWRQLLSVAPNLFKTLKLSQWNTTIDDKALKSITDFVGPRPQKIDISNCFHVTDEGFSYLINEIGIAGKIKTIKMQSNWEVSAMAIMDLTVPLVGQHLEEIDLSNCRKVRDNVMERLIGFDASEINDEEMMRMREEELDFDTSQIGCKKLKIINVGYCKHLTDNFMFHIAYHANQRLESLDLTRCTTITDRGFQEWTYRPFPNLKKLSLKDCTFLTDKAIISMANACPKLEILDLNFCCALSDVSPEALCLGCPNIRELDLSFCGSAVSDATLVTISLHLKKLERLILKGCIRVTRAGVDALLSGAPSLSYLDVSQCKHAHIYPGGIPAQKLNVNPQTKSAFVTAGPGQDIIEIVI